jgi:hypothetical protein
MPVTTEPEQHRPKLDFASPYIGFANVARTVPPSEVRTNPKAQAAMRKEWDALRERKAWSEHLVRERRDVSEEARSKGLRIHVGRIFGICVEKNRELTPDDPRRKYKGRVVFQGNNVRDEDHCQAVFQDLGSAPATMLAARIADFVALLPGCSGEVADAVRAYIQAKLTGVPTWIRTCGTLWFRSTLLYTATPTRAHAGSAIATKSCARRASYR